MNVIASRALKCSNVEAGRALGDPYQRRYSFALRTWCPVKRALDASPLASGRSITELSVTG
jgi:hypothetical protein